MDKKRKKKIVLDSADLTLSDTESIFCGKAVAGIRDLVPAAAMNIRDSGRHVCANLIVLPVPTSRPAHAVQDVLIGDIGHDLLQVVVCASLICIVLIEPNISIY